MRSRFALFFFALALAVQAAPLARELGQGLALHRVRALPGDLPAADARRQPLVLDLRYVPGDAAAATALQTWLRAHATQRTPIFVLANAATSAALRDALTARRLPAHTLVIGTPASGFTPDIAVAANTDDERRAYDALDGGTEVALLLTENADKTRNDEAALTRPPRFSGATEGATKAASPAPLDLALQRAVHLHRALVALKKL